MTPEAYRHTELQLLKALEILLPLDLVAYTQGHWEHAEQDLGNEVGKRSAKWALACRGEAVATLRTEVSLSAASDEKLLAWLHRAIERRAL